jgi:hypothetical protein
MKKVPRVFLSSFMPFCFSYFCYDEIPIFLYHLRGYLAVDQVRAPDFTVAVARLRQKSVVCSISRLRKLRVISHRAVRRSLLRPLHLRIIEMHHQMRNQLQNQKRNHMQNQRGYIIATGRVLANTPGLGLPQKNKILTKGGKREKKENSPLLERGVHGLLVQQDSSSRMNISFIHSLQYATCLS